jgi:hypothetical protein
MENSAVPTSISIELQSTPPALRLACDRLDWLHTTNGCDDNRLQDDGTEVATRLCEDHLGLLTRTTALCAVGNAGVGRVGTGAQRLGIRP